MRKTRIHGTCLALIGLAGSAAATAGEAPTFEQHVRPILKAYCLDCHGGGEKLKGKLDLRLKRFAEQGGDTGPAIVAGKPEESYLLDRLDAGEMPPGEKKVPRGAGRDHRALDRRRGGPLRPEPEGCRAGVDITPEERAYWAFQPVRRPEPPAFRAGGPGADADRCLLLAQAPRARVSRSPPRPTGAR